MKPTPVNAESELNPAHTWRPLRFLNLYRIVLAALFVTLNSSEFNLRSLGEHNPWLFDTAAYSYFAICLVNAITIHLRCPRFHIQVYLQIVLDLLIIALLMHASGGIQSGLGMLMIVSVASGSMLMAGQAAISLAAIASLFMLGEHVYLQYTSTDISTAYTQAGMLGAAFFATAALAHALAKRVRESEALAAQRGTDLANMQQLADYVIQKMQTGVVVLDSNEKIWQMNASARQLLGIEPGASNHILQEISPELTAQFRHWLDAPDTRSQPFRRDGSSAEILPRFAKLHDEGSTLVFLEDTSTTTHQAQQLKLASLGRLAGSIAHEIRNPLGAVSHAGQLLAESPNLDKNDLRMTEIIQTNSARMNSIIENVLQIGRRKQSMPETIHLKSWLEHFVKEFCQEKNIDPTMIHLRVRPESLETEFDTSQLHQVLWNLCQNGAHHSEQLTGLPRLDLNVSLLSSSPTPYLDVIDYGSGVSDEAKQHIFEPFFTTNNKGGTGLGLYIAKELSEFNHSHLSYIDTEHGGSCFRITFNDPRRRRST